MVRFYGTQVIAENGPPNYGSEFVTFKIQDSTLQDSTFVNATFIVLKLIWQDATFNIIQSS